MREQANKLAIDTGNLRAASLLGGCVLAVAVALLPMATGRSGSGGPMGLAIAATVCLLAGWVSGALVRSATGADMPLAGLLVGLAARMLPPLAVCCVLAAQRESGRDHLAFVGYLLTFYLVTLVLETWLAIQRVPRSRSERNESLR